MKRKLIFLLLLSLFLGIIGVGFYYYLKPKKVISNNVFQDAKQKVREKSSQTIVFFSDKNAYTAFTPVYFFSDRADNAYVRIEDSEGDLQKDIFEQTDLYFSKTNDIYVLKWYPNNPRYQGQLTAYLYGEDHSKLAEYDFFIRLKDTEFKPDNGSVVLGFDSKEELFYHNILSIDGKTTNTSALSDWIDIINSDVVVMPVGISESQGVDKKIWSDRKLKETLNFAGIFKSKGQKTALWIQSLSIEGNASLLDYQLAEHDNNDKSDLGLISLNDPNRLQHLKDMVMMLDTNKNVDFIGLTDVFLLDYPHNELKEIFLSEFSENNKKAFEKWKEYKFVEYFQEISQYTDKPLFYMIKGSQVVYNPNVLGMAFGAGVDFVMLDLEGALDTLDIQKEILQEKASLNEFLEHIILSYQINYDHLLGGNVSAIDNWISTSLSLLNSLGIRSARIQDFYRAVLGNRGAYPSYEWMLAIADFSSRWKDSNQQNPLSTKLIVNQRELSKTYSVALEIQNTEDTDVSDFSIELLPSQQQVLEIPKIKARSIVRTNIVVTNVSIEKNMLKRRTRYLPLKITHSSFDSVRLIPILDPSVPQDYSLDMDTDFNKEIGMLIEQEEERLRQEELSNRLLEEQLIREQEALLRQKEEDNKALEAEKLEEERLKQEEEEKKLPWWKRKRK